MPRIAECFGIAIYLYVADTNRVEAVGVLAAPLGKNGYGQ